MTLSGEKAMTKGSAQTVENLQREGAWSEQQLRDLLASQPELS